MKVLVEIKNLLDAWSLKKYSHNFRWMLHCIALSSDMCSYLKKFLVFNIICQSLGILQTIKVVLDHLKTCRPMYQCIFEFGLTMMALLKSDGKNTYDC